MKRFMVILIVFCFYCADLRAKHFTYQEDPIVYSDVGNTDVCAFAYENGSANELLSYRATALCSEISIQLPVVCTIISLPDHPMGEKAVYEWYYTGFT